LNQIQRIKTSKLFYNKWPIKVECYLKGTYKIVSLGADRTIKWCEKPDDYKSHTYSTTDSAINRVELAKFANKFKLLPKENIQIRCEGNRFHIFMADKALLEQIQLSFDSWINCITAPETDQEYDFLLDNGHKKVLCKDYPYGRYHYKIYIRENTQLSVRESFLKWIKKYDTKIHAANKTEEWLGGSHGYIRDPYIYVEDSKTLTMTLLFLGNQVKKVQEFILRDDINTECPH
jgi:hypothetical protein